MATKVWDKKPPGDADWTRARSLGGYVMVSHNEYFDEPNSIKGLNPYEGSMRLVGGSNDEGLWVDQIQGYRSGDLDWEHNGRPYRIVRCARIPYLIKSREGTTKARAYLDHVLVGYASTLTSVPEAVTLYDWTHFFTGNAGAGLWHSTTTQPKAIQNWWKPIDGTYVYGYEQVEYGDGVPWGFRDRALPVFGSIRIQMADTDRKVWDLLVGYEGGGAW